MPKYERILFEDFSGGLNDLKDTSSIPDNQVSMVTNMELSTDDKWVLRVGSDRFPDLATNYPIMGAYSFQFSTSSGRYSAIFNAGNKIYAGLTGDVPTLLSSAAPFGAIGWSWRTMNDTAIGVPNLGSAGGYTPFVYNGTTIAALGGSPPSGKFLETWNNRIFIVGHSTYPNRLYYSTLGNSADWTTTGIAGSSYIEIGYNDGDIITGIIADKERLLIFKLNKIYQIITANPNTDPTGWRVEVLTNNGGCVSHASIKSVDDDIVFISLAGVQSLQRVQLLGDFNQAALSRDLQIVESIRNVPGSGNVGVTSGIYAEYFPEKKQYIFSIGAGQQYVMQKSGKGNYVFSNMRFYRAAAQGAYNAFPIGILKYYGKSLVLFSTNNQDSLGNYPSLLWPKRFILDERFTNLGGEDAYKDDAGSTDGAASPYVVDFQTKAYVLNSGYVRTKINRVGIKFTKLGWYNTAKFTFLVYSISKDGAKRIYREVFTLDPLSFNNTGTIEVFTKAVWRKLAMEKNCTAVQFRVTASDISSDAPDWIMPIKINGFALEEAPMNQRRLSE